MPVNKKRAVVTGITLNVAYPDGCCKTITIDPRKTEALFWSERAVKLMLGKFYNENKRVVSKEDLSHLVGEKRSGKAMGRKTKLEIDESVVDVLWNTEDDDGILPPYMAKGTDCLPG